MHTARLFNKYPCICFNPMTSLPIFFNTDNFPSLKILAFVLPQTRKRGRQLFMAGRFCCSRDIFAMCKDHMANNILMFPSIAFWTKSNCTDDMGHHEDPPSMEGIRENQVALSNPFEYLVTNFLPTTRAQAYLRPSY